MWLANDRVLSRITPKSRTLVVKEKRKKPTQYTEFFIGILRNVNPLAVAFF